MSQSKKIIFHICDLLNDLSSRRKQELVWFRGHADKNWKLVPSIFRTTTKTEIDYIKEFKQKATLLVEPKPIKPYEWLFIMRHNHIPSRLLDWSESPLVALFFAVNCNEHEDKDGALWIIKPLKLNQNTQDFKHDKSLPTFDENTKVLDMYTPEPAYEFAKNKRPTLAIRAPRNSNRMQAQLSVFTINHYDKTPIEEIGKRKHIQKYLIPKEAKETLKKELNILKITNFQLFPELPFTFNERDESNEN